MENIIFLFIQHESNCWYSAKKKKKTNTWPDCRFLFLLSCQWIHAAIYVCVSILIPPEKSLDTWWFIVSFKCSRVYMLQWVQSSTFFLFILHPCQFSFSWVIGSKTHNSPIYTASLLIHIRKDYIMVAKVNKHIKFSWLFVVWDWIEYMTFRSQVLEDRDVEDLKERLVQLL